MQSPKQALWWILAGAILLLALWFASPVLGRYLPRSIPVILAAEIALTVVWVGLVVLLVRGVAGLELSFWRSVASFVVTAAVGVAMNYGHFGQKLAVIIVPVYGIIVLLGAAFLGSVVSVVFRDRNILLPIALIAPLIDYWTVRFGPVSQAIQGRPEILGKLSVVMPHATALKPLALIGAGDFLFMSMFLTAAQRLKMSPGLTAWLWVPLISAAMVAVVFWDAVGQLGMPGLVVISLGFLIANFRHFKLTRVEMATTAGLTVVVLVAVAYIQLRAH
ncbi:MAG: hypothetical protein IT209_10940 [Armatimonadetes bacterium]|nr:hypothetical protein [Armatimonadota bacterium]